MIDLEELTGRLRSRFGLSPRYTWATDAPRALEEMSHRHGGSTNRLYERLLDDPDLLSEFAAYLTVQESFFLRHPEHFALLVRLIADRSPSATREDPFTIWSAGCANGEEPYSAAIMIHARLGAQCAAKVSISATDINGDAIQRALTGLYGGWSFRGTPAWFLARYFDRSEGSKCLVTDHIRRAVMFERKALEDSLRGFRDHSFDLILFRNVAIYLAHEALERIFAALHRVLKPGGSLFLAPTDPRPPSGLFADSAEVVGAFTSRQAALAKLIPASGLDAPQPVPVPDLPLDNPELGRPLCNLAPPLLPSALKPRSDPPVDTSPGSLLRIATGMRDAGDRGHQGDRGGALRIAARLIRSRPTSKDGYLLRAWIHFTSRTFEDAVADLRRVVFLDREDKIARFWFAIALRSARLTNRASGEVAELLRQLEVLPEDMVLEDGSTTVSELRSAATGMTR